MSQQSTTSSGRFYPPFTSADFNFVTAPGAVSTDVSWSGSATLRARLTCGSASATKVGANGLYLSLTAPAAESCTLELSEAVQTSYLISYTVFITTEVQEGAS